LKETLHTTSGGSMLAAWGRRYPWRRGHNGTWPCRLRMGTCSHPSGEECCLLI